MNSTPLKNSAETARPRSQQPREWSFSQDDDDDDQPTVAGSSPDTPNILSADTSNKKDNKDSTTPARSSPTFAARSDLINSKDGNEKRGGSAISFNRFPQSITRREEGGGSSIARPVPNRKDSWGADTPDMLPSMSAGRQRPVSECKFIMIYVNNIQCVFLLCNIIITIINILITLYDI